MIKTAFGFIVSVAYISRSFKKNKGLVWHPNFEDPYLSQYCPNLHKKGINRKLLIPAIRLTQNYFWISCLFDYFLLI